MANPITKENKEQWVSWIKKQLDTTSNADYTKTETNRVFLTEEDDIDIARYVLEVMLETAKSI